MSQTLKTEQSVIDKIVQIDGLFNVTPLKVDGKEYKIEGEFLNDLLKTILGCPVVTEYMEGKGIYDHPTDKVLSDSNISKYKIGTITSGEVVDGKLKVTAVITNHDLATKIKSGELGFSIGFTHTEKTLDNNNIDELLLEDGTAKHVAVVTNPRIKNIKSTLLNSEKTMSSPEKTMSSPENEDPAKINEIDKTKEVEDIKKVEESKESEKLMDMSKADFVELITSLLPKTPQVSQEEKEFSVKSKKFSAPFSITKEQFENHLEKIQTERAIEEDRADNILSSEIRNLIN